MTTASFIDATPAHRRILDAVAIASTDILCNNHVPVSGLVGTTIVARTFSGGWCMFYHGTPVALFGGGKFKHTCLATGGYYTATTCRRINQALAAAGRIGWRVSRRDGVYVLVTPRWRREFTNEVLVNHEDTVVHAR